MKYSLIYFTNVIYVDIFHVFRNYAQRGTVDIPEAMFKDFLMPITCIFITNVLFMFLSALYTEF